MEKLRKMFLLKIIQMKFLKHLKLKKCKKLLKNKVLKAMVMIYQMRGM